MRRTVFAGLAALVFLITLTPAADKAPAPGTKPIQALLVIGGCCHDYKTQKDILTKGISERANVQVTVAYDPVTGNDSKDHLNPIYNKAEWAKGFDVVIHDEC